MIHDCYLIVANETILDEFIEWLPDLAPTEKFYCCLFARKKYDDALSSTSSDKAQLKRFLATKENLKKKLLQLEIPIGRYDIKGTPVTQQSLSAYITPNPRDCTKAYKNLLVKAAVDISAGNFTNNPHQEAMSHVQRAARKPKWVMDFDIDTKDVDIVSIMQSILPPQEHFMTKKMSPVYSILETRGGYHVLVDREFAAALGKEGKVSKQWYNEITEQLPIDKGSKPDMIPIPGTWQGGFIPRFIEI